MPVPLSRPPVDDEIRAAVLAAIDSRRYILGPESRAFEEEFARYVGSRHAILTSSGTAALWMALKALGVKADDEVLVPSHTAFPTVEAVCFAGAVPVFVDVDDSYTVDLEDAALKVSARTVGFVPVHLYGHPADMLRLREVADRKGIPLLEDACQAHGAEVGGKRVGTLGSLAAFSFFPSKNLSVAGDGGAIVTNDDELAAKVAMFKDAGRAPGAKYEHDTVGLNLRMSELHAAIGRVMLKRLPGWVERRRALARLYAQELHGTPGLTLPTEAPGTKHGWHLYVVRHARRDALAEHLKKRGIEVGVHYPMPLHQQPALKVYHRGPLPESERAAKGVLSLPVHPLLSDDDVRRVAREVRAFCEGREAGEGPRRVAERSGA